MYSLQYDLVELWKQTTTYDSTHKDQVQYQLRMQPL